jgi:hypothetical protein
MNFLEDRSLGEYVGRRRKRQRSRYISQEIEQEEKKNDE